MIEYYYLDWVAMAMAFLATYLLGKKVRWGFLVFMLSALLWVLVGKLAMSTAMVVGNAIFFLMNARSLFQWSKGASKVV